jgi:hypothetical protein
VALGMTASSETKMQKAFRFVSPFASAGFGRKQVGNIPAVTRQALTLHYSGLTTQEGAGANDV